MQRRYYQNFKDLEEHETREQDYRIRYRYGSSAIAVMAPHGGGIEPGTTQIADAVAGREHTFYAFIGLKQKGNAALHITSRNFDEPRANEIAENSLTVLTIHGCRGDKKCVYIGGRDLRLKKRIAESLQEAGFPVREVERYPGKNPHNLCNRSRSGMGVQLEITSELRREIVPELAEFSIEKASPRFRRFVAAMRRAIAEEADPGLRE